MNFNETLGLYLDYKYKYLSLEKFELPMFVSAAELVMTGPVPEIYLLTVGSRVKRQGTYSCTRAICWVAYCLFQYGPWLMLR